MQYTTIMNLYNIVYNNKEKKTIRPIINYFRGKNFLVNKVTYQYVYLNNLEVKTSLLVKFV